MAFWLLKTEPETWSWDMQVKRGARGEVWSGVRSHMAKNNLLKMKRGELAFFYHSGHAKEIVGVIQEIVGVVQVIREAYADPTDDMATFVAIDVRAVGPIRVPVSLSAIKAQARLKSMILVRNSRLSVQPVSAAEWKIICKMGQVD
jgi:predicted RNA-binding protein with PUA-like domain